MGSTWESCSRQRVRWPAALYEFVLHSVAVRHCLHGRRLFFARTALPRPSANRKPTAGTCRAVRALCCTAFVFVQHWVRGIRVFFARTALTPSASVTSGSVRTSPREAVSLCGVAAATVRLLERLSRKLSTHPHQLLRGVDARPPYPSRVTADQFHHTPIEASSGPFSCPNEGSSLCDLPRPNCALTMHPAICR